TAAIWPSWNFLTSLPILVTRPTISWPGTHGYTVGITSFHSLSAWCKSEWHTPQYKISSCTSPGRGARRLIVCAANRPVGLGAANAFAGNVVGEVRAASLMGCLLKAVKPKLFGSRTGQPAK